MRRSCLVWSLELVDASNKSGSMEFVVPAAQADAFFPIEVRRRVGSSRAGRVTSGRRRGVKGRAGGCLWHMGCAAQADASFPIEVRRCWLGLARQQASDARGLGRSADLGVSADVAMCSAGRLGASRHAAPTGTL